MSGAGIWLGALVLYGLFRLWYDGIPRPLTPAEIDDLVARLPKQSLDDPAEVARLRRFLEEDDGREFAMVNLVRLSPDPVPHPVTGEPVPARDLLMRYSRDFFKVLGRRAGHPAIAARAAGGYLDSWNVPPDPGWTIVGYVRYRSRRDMMAVVIDPRFADAHLFKIAATPVTLSFPTKPMILLFASPRVWVGLAIALAAALLHLAIR